MKIENWNSIKFSNEITVALEIAEMVQSMGYDCYIVGGAARDIIMGVVPNDVDLVTSMPQDKVEGIFDQIDIGKNKEMGINVIKYKGYTYELAQYRHDVYDKLGGKGADKIELVKDFESDTARRDLTINAIGINVAGEIMDYHGGVDDINNQVIRMVGNPYERIEEDALRLLRVVRFAARFGFDIDLKTFAALGGYSHKIHKVSPERILKELMGMAKAGGSKFADAILLLKKTGLLNKILPEVAALDNFEHSGTHHPEKDEDGRHSVFIHVIWALRNTDFTDPVVNMSILFHDLGKAQTYSESGDGYKHFYNHESVGSHIVDEIADRLKFDNNLRKACKFAARNHMKYHHIMVMSNKKVAELIDSPYFDVLQQTSYADDKARGHLFHDERWQEVLDKIERIKELYAGRQILQEIGAVVNGKWIMELRNLGGGSEVGRIKNAAVDWIINNNIDINDTEAIKDFILNVE